MESILEDDYQRNAGGVRLENFACRDRVSRHAVFSRSAR